MYKKIQRHSQNPRLFPRPAGLQTETTQSNVTTSPLPEKARGRYDVAKTFARHPFAVPIITFLVLAVIFLIVYGVMHRTNALENPNVVVISHDGEKQIVSSKQPTVGALLEKLELQLNEGDVVEPSKATKIQQDDFRINIYRASPIEVVDGGQRMFTFSASTTERSVASQAGLIIYPEDKLIKEPITDFVASGSISERVTIERAKPIEVNLYGSKVTMRTHAMTVKDLLRERKVQLKPEDQVTPGLDSPLAQASLISVVRNGITTVTVEEAVAVPVQSIPDNNLAYGTSAVRQKGAEGKKVVIYEVNTQNGVEASRKIIQETIVRQPVPEIRVIGSNLSGIKGDMALAGISPSDYQYVDHIVSKESGWCPTKWQGEYGKCPAYHGTPTNPNIGYGLCQATPGSKMATAGADWATNPVTQLKWCHSYAIRTYNNWTNAYNFSRCVGDCVQPRTGASIYKRTQWW